MKCAWLWAALGAASWAGCGDPNATGVTQLNLDRPVDISFACYGAMRQTNGRLPADPADRIIPTAQPLAACEALSPALTPAAGAPIHPAPGQETLTGSDGKPLANNPIVPSWYAFILQSASGTVALAKWPTKAADTIVSGVSDSGGDFAVLDGDPLTPGKNAISIGEDPVAIATDKAGCFEVTANAGSCDLSELDINSALDGIPPVPGKAATPVRVDRVPVTITDISSGKLVGEIHAKPAAMVAAPTVPAPGTTDVGHACATTATGRVYIAYPSCHLVAGVDLGADVTTGKPTAMVVTGIKYDALGFHVLSSDELKALTCPDECSGAAMPAGAAGAQPVALDLRIDTRVDSSKAAVTSRLVIGTRNSLSPAAGQATPLTIVDLDPATSDPDPLSPPFRIVLEDPKADGTTSKLAVSAVALSPQIGMGGNVPDGNTTDQTAPGDQAQYVYAVATDGTVRVADVLKFQHECDTQIDGRFVHGLDVKTTQCFQPGAAATPPRRSDARGPGIALPGGAVPTSVAIIKGRSTPPTDSTTGSPLGATPTTLLGYFAIVTASNGVGYVVNIDDDYAPDVALRDTSSAGDLLKTSPALVMAHQLRDSFSNRAQGPETPDGMLLCKATDPIASHGGALGGGPRLISSPAAGPPTGTIMPGNVLPLPTIRQVACTLDQATVGMTAVSELEYGAPDDARKAVYPDLRNINSETWSLTWEGTLSLDNILIAVDGPVIRSGQIAVDGHGMTLNDPARPFCEMGVEPFDIVDLRGCSPANGDGDCPAGYTCYVHPKSQGIGVGACMLKTEAPRLADACRDFMTTLRRYTVGTVDTGSSPNAGQLILLERKHELANTPVDGCVDDNQCVQLAQDAFKIDPSTDPFDSQKTQWACEPDPLRSPINADPASNKRCVQHCSLPTPGPNDPDPMNHQANCPSGTICQRLHPKKPGDPGPDDPAGICMEGVEPPQECVRGPQRYDVRASEAFTVIGQHTGYVHTVTEKPNGACEPPAPNPTAQTVKVGRIPINPTKVPACAAVGTTNLFTGELNTQPGVFEPNPCSLSVQQFDAAPQVDMPACALDPHQLPPDQQPKAARVRTAQAIRFRNQSMMLTLVDPYQSCLPNGQGSPALVPLASRGYQIAFAQKAGFLPLQLPLIAPTYPVKVVRGPSESFWVIDDGDFVSTSITQASTSGRVFRVEGIDINTANIMQ